MLRAPFAALAGSRSVASPATAGAAGPRSRWPVALLTALVWALAAGGAVAWGLRFVAAPSAPMPQALAPAAAPADPTQIARLLGASSASTATVPEAPPLAARFVLSGVVASTSGQAGVALLSVDGKPARPFRVGARIDDTLVLQSLGPRRAAIGTTADGPPALVLELPATRR